GLRFGDDCEDFHGATRDVIEHTNLIDPEPVFRSAYSLQALDAALAHLRRLMPQVRLQCCTNRAPEICLQRLKVLNRLRRKNDLISHSGQTVARLRPASTIGSLCA